MAKSKACATAACCFSKMCGSIRKKKRTTRNFRSSLPHCAIRLFVCDAFGSAHRAHASVVGITKFVRQAAAGLLMEKELAYLGRAISNPDRPFVAVLGGAKVSDKIEVVQNLMKIADAMLIGGAMAYTFLKSQGLPVGKSLVENDKLDLARDLLDERTAATSVCSCRSTTCSRNRLRPRDKTTDIADTPEDRMGLDMGPKTIELFGQEISQARGRLSGTGRSGCSKSRRSRRARSRWLARLRPRQWPGDFHRGRRGFRGGGRAVRRRQTNFAHFDRRWRFARIPRGRKIAGGRSA